MKMSPGKVSLTLVHNASKQLLMLLPHAACSEKTQTCCCWCGLAGVIATCC